MVICQTFHAGFMNFSRRKEHQSKSKAHICKSIFCVRYSIGLGQSEHLNTMPRGDPRSSCFTPRSPFCQVTQHREDTIAVTWRPDSLDTSDPAKNRDKCLSLYNLKSGIRSIVFYFCLEIISEFYKLLPPSPRFQRTAHTGHTGPGHIFPTFLLRNAA